MSVRAAITAIKNSSSMGGVLKSSINFTGDVDTVATIALAGASQSREINQDLPQILYDKLENGQYGKDYLTKLSKNLMAIKKTKS